MTKRIDVDEHQVRAHSCRDYGGLQLRLKQSKEGSSVDPKSPDLIHRQHRPGKGSGLRIPHARALHRRPRAK